MSRPATRSESVVGPLVGTGLLSALAWWGLSFTSLPDLAVAWLSGLVAGLSALRAIHAAARTLAGPAATPRKRR
ncbi:hypothetical protein [Microbispora triticiradicis]|uniref:Uncharacterized protein n=2 Tax=Microbispora TaxID=2005 RepID=A0ABY3LRB5_9ACTN|nr:MULTISPECIES: hypothetical protein [Microbispora]TLP66524.1 hypothetical protein FED44_03425 [Microbispora fusca]TYB47417.1 hypothetical protein FXF59_29825 [Microbispora tritici]